MSVCSWWHPFVWILLLLSNGFTSPFRKKRKRIVTITNIILNLNKYHIKTLQEEFAKKSNIPWIWRFIYGHKLPYMKKTKEEANMWCSLLHGSWDQILQRRTSIHLLLPDRNHQSVGLWYWKLMSHPDPVVLPVGTKKSTLHSLEWFWVIRRIFIYSHYNTTVFFF